MFAEGYRHIRERRIADRPVVDEHLCPGLGVDADAPHRRRDGQRAQDAGPNRHRLTDAVTERAIHQVKLMRPGGGHDRAVRRRSEYPIAFEDLELDRRRKSHASRALVRSRLVDRRHRTTVAVHLLGGT